MKLQSQCCTLEQAKRLKELGVKQESLFKWNCQTNYGFGGIHENREDWNIIYGNPPLLSELVYSAFTCAELGEMLPDRVPETIDGKWLIQQKVGLWEVGYGNQTTDVSFEAKNEAEACSSMLIYLIENKLITVDDINSKE